MTASTPTKGRATKGRATKDDGRDLASRTQRLTVIAIVVTVVVPFVALLIWSFAFSWFFPDLLPSRWSVDSWEYVKSPNSKVFSSLWNSVTLGLLVCLMALIVGLPASSRARERWSCS